MQLLNLSHGRHPDVDIRDVDDMVALAAMLDHSSNANPRPGDMIWAKVTGHPMWPAIVLDESAASNIELLNKISGEQSVLVQFFGDHDFARLSKKHVIPFLKGLYSKLHRKCKRSNFRRSLMEAMTYLGDEKLPNEMLSLQSSNKSNLESASGEEDGTRDEDIPKNLNLRSCRFEVGGLQIKNLGKILKESELLYDCNYICPEGYTAVRKFPLISDPKKGISYKMEVLRDGNMLNKPMFRVTSEKGDRFEGPTSSSCWDKLYGKLRKLHSPDALNAFEEQNKIVRSGPNFFGFSHPEIRELIQLSLTKERPSHSSKFAFKRCEDLAVGYRSIHITWKDLDKCNVCHTDEEYDINPFLQCENCRMLRSAETFFLDERKMEPIDGLNRMNKYRLKVLCSICKVSHGACIQCSHSSCRVAYHPLCARTAGFYHEFENEDRLCHNSGKEDEDNLRIRLISYCKRHRRPSDKGIVVQDKIGQSACQQSDYIPSPNPSGCARTEPYDYLSRRGRKEPQSHEIVPLKRLYWRTGHT